jgi:Flp pilus assembly CpaE family ATPase
MEFSVLRLACVPERFDVFFEDSGLPHLLQNLALLAFTVPQDKHAFDISTPPFLEYYE